MKTEDVIKIIKVILPDVKVVKSMTGKDLAKWTIMSLVKLGIICFFLWFLVIVLKLNFSIGK